MNGSRVTSASDSPAAFNSVSGPESETLYRAIFEAAIDAIFLMQGHRFVDCNRVTFKMFGGGDKAEIVGRSPDDFSPPRQPDGQDSGTKAAALVDAALAGRPQRFYWRHRRLDGTEFDAEVGLNRIELGNQLYTLAIVRDITRRLQDQQALRESEEKYRQLFEMESDAIFVIENEDGRIREVNPAAVTMYGYTREELLAMRNVDVSAEPRDTRQATVERRPKVPLRYHRKKDGTVFPVEIVSRHCTWQGRDVHVAAIRDISFRTDAERHTREMQTRLQHADKMEAVGTLAGGVAHDFNNILQAIRGYTELLQHGAALPPGDARKLKEILHLADRGGELVQQLLTFSRKVETQKRPLDLNRQVENARKMLVRTIPKMIAIETRLAPDIDIVEADPAQLQRVLVNLALNARDAMPDGGTLRLGTANVALDEDFCRRHTGARPGPYVCLEVEDTGRGMTPATRDRIFEPFFTTKARGKGTGLGLAIVYGLVKDHGGYIDCRSAPGEGTRFRIFLPAVSVADEEAAEEADAGQRPDGGAETILVVDDEDHLLEIAEEILTSFGYRVLTAPDGETALEICRRQDPQIALVILDLIMPGMGGRRCLQMLRQGDADIPVIVSSGYSAEGERSRLDALGAAGFIGKPYNLHDLLREVRRVLDA